MDATWADTVSSTPISQLGPDLPDQSSRVVDGVVTVTWPYSIVTRSVAFVVAEKDFLLRRDKGQVRVELHGAAAKAIQDAGIAGGDEVRIKLDGVRWEACPASARLQLENQLVFSNKLDLTLRRAETQEVRAISVDGPPEDDHDDEESILSNIPDVLSSPPLDIAPMFATPRAAISPPKRSAALLEPDEFASPAYLKRARVSYGSLFEGGLDIFDREATKKKNKSPAKKARFSMGAMGWRYSSKSPSPEPERASEDELDDPSEEEDAEEEISIPKPKPKMVDEASQTQSATFATALEQQSVPSFMPDTPTPATRLGDTSTLQELAQDAGLGHDTFGASSNLFASQPAYRRASQSEPREELHMPETLDELLAQEPVPPSGLDIHNQLPVPSAFEPVTSGSFGSAPTHGFGWGAPPPLPATAFGAPSTGFGAPSATFGAPSFAAPVAKMTEPVEAVESRPAAEQASRSESLVEESESEDEEELIIEEPRTISQEIYEDEEEEVEDDEDEGEEGTDYEHRQATTTRRIHYDVEDDEEEDSQNEVEDYPSDEDSARRDYEEDEEDEDEDEDQDEDGDEEEEEEEEEEEPAPPPRPAQQAPVFIDLLSDSDDDGPPPKPVPAPAPQLKQEPEPESVEEEEELEEEEPEDDEEEENEEVEADDAQHYIDEEEHYDDDDDEEEEEDEEEQREPISNELVESDEEADEQEAEEPDESMADAEPTSEAVETIEIDDDSEDEAPVAAETDAGEPADEDEEDEEYDAAADNALIEEPEEASHAMEVDESRGELDVDETEEVEEPEPEPEPVAEPAQEAEVTEALASKRVTRSAAAASPPPAQVQLAEDGMIETVKESVEAPEPAAAEETRRDSDQNVPSEEEIDDAAAEDQIMGEFLQHSADQSMAESSTVEETAQPAVDLSISITTRSLRSHKRTQSAQSFEQAPSIDAVLANAAADDEQLRRSPRRTRKATSPAAEHSARLTRTRASRDTSAALTKALASTDEKARDPTPRRSLHRTRTMMDIAGAGPDQILDSPYSPRVTRSQHTPSEGTPANATPEPTAAKNAPEPETVEEQFEAVIEEAVEEAQEEIAEEEAAEQVEEEAADAAAEKAIEDAIGGSENGAPLKVQVRKSLSTLLPDNFPLDALRHSQNKIGDVLAVAASTPASPTRPRKGPRDYMLEVLLTDPTSPSTSVYVAHLYRPHQAALPMVREGDVVLLRRMQVTSMKGRGFGLKCTDASSWAVFEQDSPEEAPQIRGPPVEVTTQEFTYAQSLHKWWQGLEKRARDNLTKASKKASQK